LLGRFGDLVLVLSEAVLVPRNRAKDTEHNHEHDYEHDHEHDRLSGSLTTEGELLGPENRGEAEDPGGRGRTGHR
jgi:hypothetical protein